MEILQVNLKKHEIIRSKRNGREDYSPFSMIGVIRDMTNMERTEKDIFDILEGLPKGAFSLFNELKMVRNGRTNMCYYPFSNLSVPKQSSIRRALSELYRAKVIVRATTTDLLNPVKKQTYMINPNMLKCWEYERSVATWNLLTKGGK